MNDNDDATAPRGATRGDSNPPPETPREVIWEAIESTLEAAPPEEILRAMKDVYHPPPEVPSEAIWAEIAAALPKRSGSAQVIPLRSGRRSLAEPRRVWPGRWATLATAAAALVVMGVGIGRLSVGPTTIPAEVGETASAPAAGAFWAAAVGHLSRTESLLTMVISDARMGRVDAEVSEWGRDLLLQTRLLIDSPASDNPLLRELLEDLELILIQVARLAPGLIDEEAQVGELGLITEGLNDNDMLLRIRSVLPVGPVQIGI
jgi:hypothetical protein